MQWFALDDAELMGRVKVFLEVMDKVYYESYKGSGSSSPRAVGVQISLRAKVKPAQN
jgi:hypothetical protein